MAKKKNNTALLLLIAAGAAAAFFLFKGNKNSQFSNMSPADKADALMAYINKNKPLNTNTEQYAAALICSIQNSEDATLFLQRLKNQYNTDLETVVSNLSKAMQDIIEQDWAAKNINIRKANILKDAAAEVKQKLMM